MGKTGSFSIRNMIDHITNQVIMADADMQLNQGQAWRELAKDMPVSAGNSHLKFLGLHEIEFNFNLARKKDRLIQRILQKMKLRKKAKTNLYEIVTPVNSEFRVKLMIERKIQNQFTTRIESDLSEEEIDKGIIAN